MSADATQSAESAVTAPVNDTSALLAAIVETVEGLKVSSERYHTRAEQREGVIDHLHSEVDRLRRGERRGLLRPLLVEICRLRNDLLRQAEDLPADFDADRARRLLQSYADSVELALEDNGVTTFTPEKGDRFEPRLHRRVGGEPTSDPRLAGHVAHVRRNGYLDSDSNTPIAAAEVVLFTADGRQQESQPPPINHGEPGDTGARADEPVPASDERKDR